jgi:arylsulfatase A
MSSDNSQSTVTRKKFIQNGLIAASAVLGFSGIRYLYGILGEEEAGALSMNDVSKLIKRVDVSGSPPNIIIINTDDLGYGDVGCYGSRAIRTPHIDSLARDGVRFTEFYSCNPICAPSRAGLMTGRYPIRVGITDNPFPEDEPITAWLPRKLGEIFGALGIADLRKGGKVAPGISPREITLAEALKVAGYRTGMVGKWHLGDYSKNPEFNPRRHGFDDYFGVPHSNDMWPCALYRNEEQLEADIGLNQARLTGLYTKEAIRFIRESKGKPFFFYFAHTFPHQPLFPSERFEKKSRGGKYGDVIEEIDWSVGEILRCLRERGLEKNTLVIFTSDNGCWYEGSPGSLRGRKGQSYEGGFSVPFIARWPGRIPRGSVCSEPAMNIDLFPTALALAGLEPPGDRIIDGKDISGLLTGRAKQTPHDIFYFYHYNELEGVRMGRWKYLRKTNRYVYSVPLDTAAVPDTLAGKVMGNRWPLLYDLSIDRNESYNVINTYPEVAEKLSNAMVEWEAKISKNPGGWL